MLQCPLFKATIEIGSFSAVFVRLCLIFKHLWVWFLSKKKTTTAQSSSRKMLTRTFFVNGKKQENLYTMNHKTL